MYVMFILYSVNQLKFASTFFHDLPEINGLTASDLFSRSGFKVSTKNILHVIETF